MAATKSQGKSFAGFLVGITVTAAGAAGFATGIGKLALAVGVIVLICTVAKAIKIKPEEGNVPRIKQAVVLQLGGVVLAVAGWLVPVFCMHLTANTGARLAIVIVGLIVSLVGALALLPMAANKSAIWKA